MIKISRPTCPDPGKLTVQVYDDPVNKAALIKASFGKCIYCESSVRHVDWGEIEHIKPKDSFPHLKFVWENLGFVCARCNNKKGIKFDEQVPYINPYEEEPSDFITAEGSMIMEKEDNVRGRNTIVDIGLNRDELLEKRYEAIRRIKKTADALALVAEPKKSILLEELKEEASEDKEFSFVIKQLFQ